LREAVIAANANPGSDTIVIPAVTVTLATAGRGEDAAQTGDLDLTDDVTITSRTAGFGSTMRFCLDEQFRETAPKAEAVMHR
jgi:hypothetical protein